MHSFFNYQLEPESKSNGAQLVKELETLKSINEWLPAFLKLTFDHMCMCMSRFPFLRTMPLKDIHNHGSSQILFYLKYM